MTKRVVIYIDESQHKRLKSKLALRGLTVSSWVRVQVKKYNKI